MAENKAEIKVEDKAAHTGRMPTSRHVPRVRRLLPLALKLLHVPSGALFSRTATYIIILKVLYASQASPFQCTLLLRTLDYLAVHKHPLPLPYRIHIPLRDVRPVRLLT